MHAIKPAELKKASTMTKSSNYGQYREDAYISRKNSNARDLAIWNGLAGRFETITHETRKNVSLNQSRKFVRENILKLGLVELHPEYSGCPWQCECEVDQVKKPAAVLRPEFETVFVDGKKYEGKIAVLKSLLF